MRSHFLSPDEIAGMFAGLPAEISITRKENIAWVIVEKYYRVFVALKAHSWQLLLKPP